MARIFFIGLAAALRFGTEVHGATNTELRIARVALLQALPPYIVASHSAKVAVHGDPTFEFAVGPAMSWAKVVWKAAVGDTFGLSMPELMRLWTKAAPEKTKSWKCVCGPLAAACLSLRRLGWATVGPFEWRTRDGTPLKLTEHSPAMIRKQLYKSNQAAFKKKPQRSATTTPLGKAILRVEQGLHPSDKGAAATIRLDD